MGSTNDHHWLRHVDPPKIASKTALKMRAPSAELTSRETIHRGGHRTEVTSLAFNCDGSLIAAGGDASSTLVFAVEQTSPYYVDTKAVYECKGHSENIERVCWNPQDAKSFASAGVDRMINTYDLREGASPTHTFKAEEKCLNMAWAPDGNFILVSDEKDAFYKVDTRTWQMESAITFGAGEINEFKWNTCGDRLFLARGSGRVAVVQWPSLEMLNTLDAHTERCHAIAVDAGDKYLAVSSEDTTVSVWDANTLANRFVIDQSERHVRIAAYDHVAEMLALADAEKGIQLTCARTGGVLAEIETSSPANCLSWHPARQLLAYSLDRPERSTPGAKDGAPMFNVWGYPEVASV